jgi:hypothetical protein
MAKYTTYEQDQIEVILYFQWRIDKAYQELMKRHKKRDIAYKLVKVREGRTNEIH